MTVEAVMENQIETVTQAEFDAVASGGPYYAGRWPYLSKVCEIIKALKLHGPALEIGAYKLPLVRGSDTLDISDKSGLPLTFQRDASETPWPITDKGYGLVIALQVWEHLRRKSHPAPFLELQRIAHWAILSFPYMWNCEKDTTHHGIGDAEIASWTAGHPHLRWLIGPENGNRRMICVFRFGE